MAAMHDEALLPERSADLPERPRTSLAGLFTEAIGDPVQRVTVIGGLVCLALFACCSRITSSISSTPGRPTRTTATASSSR